MLCNNWRLIFYWLKYKENKKEMLSGQQKHKNAYDMITLGIKNTMKFYRFLNEEKKKKWESNCYERYEIYNRERTV